MLASNKIIGFVLTTDFARARDFYEGKLGLQFVGQDDFALVLSAGGNMIRIAKAPEFTPLHSTVLGWEVTDIEAEAKWLESRGVQLEKYPWVQSETGIWSAPGGDKVAWFKDPDGNVLSLSQHAAKR
jgi:catechol 2,3-dioxygenase-like lactoylglutathione lyase family enzyme